SYYYQGSIDEVKIYNYARTPGQVLADMQSSRPDELNPLFHYKFDEQAGTTFYDSGLAKANAGMVNGSVSRITGGARGGALSFNKDLTGYIQATSPQSIILGDVSLSAWINVRSWQDDKTIVRHAQNAPSSYAFEVQANRTLELQWY